MRAYGKQKTRSKHNQRSHNGQCSTCEPDNPTHGTARQRGKLELEIEIKEDIEK